MKTRLLFAVFAVGAIVLPAKRLQARPRHVGPVDIYPIPTMTPGAASPKVTQQNIKDNICNRHWSTKLVRPPSGYTSRLKRKQLREYGDTVHQTRAELINPSTGKVDVPAVWRIPTTWPATRRTT
jgi:hypothetical protein